MTALGKREGTPWSGQQSITVPQSQMRQPIIRTHYCGQLDQLS